jgi:DNA helicase-4
MLNSVIRPSILGNFLNKYSKIEYDNKYLYLFIKNKKEESFSWREATGFVKINSGIFSSSIEFTFDSTPLKIDFLKKSDCKNSFNGINELLKNIIDERIINKKNILNKYTQLEYLRDSNVVTLENELLPLFNSYNNQREYWNKSLSIESCKFLNGYSEYFPLTEQSVQQLREEFESKTLNNRSSFYDKIESNPLTEEQRLAVIRDNDRNLVLAAAGTGKTSVMVAKALDIIDRGIAQAENILILAYNKDAAKELQERLNLRGKDIFSDGNKKPQIKTFHALGREILFKAKQSVKISVFSEKPETLEKWISEWFVTKMQSDDKFMEKFIKLSYQPINPFDFKSKEEYDNYIRDNDYLTLQGEYVRGYQELLIANWLYLNCIEYEYEPSYISKQRIEIGFDYRPDFFLTDYDIYLEHFGIDRAGNTRVDIDKDKYNYEIQQKRDLHNSFNTKLIETYHYNWTEGNLESTLLQHTIDNNITIKKRPKDEIFKRLNKTEFLVNGIKRYLKCLQAIRVERLSDDDVYAHLEKDKIVNAKEYTELLSSIHSAYIEELSAQDCIDFDDMIIRAITEVNNKNFKPKWTHILVDEFQDISAARMEFLNSLINNGPSPRLTVVGDDWQSIYRFSGGKLELTTQFESRVGSCTSTMLQKTFRYNNSIAFTAGEFVMQNPEQYVKNVVTHTKVDSSQVYLLDSQVSKVENLELKTAKVIEEIIKNEPNASISVIARYRYLLTNTKEVVSKLIPNKEIKYWTFHGSKGLESDYCILIGFFQGKTGFPNENKEEAVVEALLPSLDTFEHSEERRLLYVGITRAKKKSYLIADPKATSVFINELLSPKFKLHISSKSFNEQYREIFKCNVCTTGYYKIKKGEYGEFYSCTSGKSCRSKPRICSKCGAPSIDYEKESICNNKNCGFVMKICEVCGRPMKKRDGKFGPFWGCTGYGLKEDQCNNIRKI